MKEYWTCEIGPFERQSLSDGADFPMRQAVKAAFKNLTGVDANHCYSGWGVSESERQEIGALRHEQFLRKGGKSSKIST